MFPSPSLGAPLLSPSASPPPFCGIPDGGGVAFVVVGGAGGGVLFVVVGGGAGAGAGVGEEVVGATAWVVGVGVGVAAGACTVTTSLARMCWLDARVTVRSCRPGATPWNVILLPALRLTDPRT
jgi:hypothetical protein